MSYCTRGRELLLDLKRSAWLPPYDDEGVRIIINEVDDLTGKLESMIESGDNNEEFLPSQLPSISYHKACIGRDIRYINSYMSHRLGKIRQLRWESGTVLPESVQQETLSDQERTYFDKYSNIISDYNQIMGIDLTADLEPPKDLLIQIRVLQSCGELMTESGPVQLTKGVTSFLRRAEVEDLIRKGLVEHVQTEDNC